MRRATQHVTRRGELWQRQPEIGQNMDPVCGQPKRTHPFRNCLGPAGYNRKRAQKCLKYGREARPRARVSCVKQYLRNTAFVEFSKQPWPKLSFHENSHRYRPPLQKAPDRRRRVDGCKPVGGVGHLPRDPACACSCGRRHQYLDLFRPAQILRQWCYLHNFTQARGMKPENGVPVWRRAAAKAL